MMLRRNNGWFRESFRHSLAARGVKTNRYFSKVTDIWKKKSEFAGWAPTLKDVKEGEPIEPVAPEVKKALSAENNPVEGYEDVLKATGSVGKTHPRSLLERMKKGEELEKEVTKAVKSQGDVEKALEFAQKDQIGLALKLLTTGKTSDGLKLTASQKEALQRSLNEHAVRLAQAGLTVPDYLKETMDAGMRERINALEELNKRELESPLHKMMRESAQKAAAEFWDAGPALLSEVGREGALGQISAEEKKFTGTSGQIEKLEATPPFEPVGPGGANYFIDDEGNFGDFNVPKTSDRFNFEPLTGGGNTNILMKDDVESFGGGMNVALGGSLKPGAKGGVVQQQQLPVEKVSQQVNQMYQKKAELSRVNLKPFEEGTKAFEKGDREKLLKSITELKSEEAKLKDRWDLVGQTHAQLKSLANHDSAFMKKESVLGAVLGGNGAQELANQTKKLSEVRKDLMEANEKAYARRKMLEYRLQRLDAMVPPETWVPKAVKRFDEKNDVTLNGLFDQAIGK